MVRPSVAVVSRVAGLREAFEARGITGSWLQWVKLPADGDKISGTAQRVLSECEVLVGEPADCAPLVGDCSSLKWLQSTFAGCNPLLAPQLRRDYTVTRLAGAFGPDMAEYTLLHILSLERKYEEQRAAQQRRDWVATRNPESGERQGGAAYRRCSTLTLGVLGLGDIGTCIASAVHHGVRMRVVGWRRDASPRESDARAGVCHVHGGRGELAAFLSKCDYIVSVLPSTPETAGLLDGDALAPCAARRPALINVGRGDLLSESSIVGALDREWLSWYVGDVFAPEPLTTSSALWHHPRVTVTPHNSAVTLPSDVAEAFAANLERYETGGLEQLRNVFRWDAGY